MLVPYNGFLQQKVLSKKSKKDSTTRIRKRDRGETSRTMRIRNKKREMKEKIKENTVRNQGQQKEKTR